MPASVTHPMTVPTARPKKPRPTATAASRAAAARARAALEAEQYRLIDEGLERIRVRGLELSAKLESMLERLS